MLSDATRKNSGGGPLGWLDSGIVTRIPARLMVFAGVVAFALYIAMDVIASLAYDGYSYRDHTISELSAIDAPTRGWWLVFGAVHQLLSFAFAFGVLRVAGERRLLRAVGWLLLAFAAVNVLWWFAPMHQREVLAAGGDDWRDTMHLALGAVTSLIFFATIGIGAFVFGRAFKLYSFATIAFMLVFGSLMNMAVPKVGDNEPTPWLGIWERIVVEGAMLWLAVFAVVVLWGRQRPYTRGSAEPRSGKG